MKLTIIEPSNFQIQPVDIWDNQGMLLTAGDFSKGHYNTMTVGWGSMGYLWRRPFIQVVVRPVRYTYEFMERYDTFSVCAFPKKYRDALNLLGTKSGRDGDKITEAGLTPVAGFRVAAPGFVEAELIMECRKIYWDDLNPGKFIDATLEAHYPRKDYHRIYIGEILSIRGTGKYTRAR